MSDVSLCPNCKALTWYGIVKCICGYIKVRQLITLIQYRGATPLSDDLETNATDLLIKVNSLLQELGVSDVHVTSGYRTPEHNLKIGGALKSNHCKAQAIDLKDDDRAIGNRIMTNLKVLISRGLHMESLDYCVTSQGHKWIHLQSVAPQSKSTVFIPYSGAVRYV